MLDVRKSPELQAAILTMRRLDSELRRDIYEGSRAEIGGAWLPALQQRAGTALERRIILKGARVRVGTDGFSLLAATSKKALRNGLVPADSWPASEFGARPRVLTYKRHSTLGNIHDVTRRINTQFRSRVKDGRVAFDAASELGTRLVGAWVRIIVDKVRAAAQAEE